MIYDTIIVGAGSAGCVLANRLSEDPDHSVLLLEAGPDYRDLNSLPPDVANGYSPTFDHDWGYSSEAGAAGYEPIPLARGKLVGGCSATNATFCLRGAPADYDAWASLGNPGWSFAEVLPFFRKLENDADFKNEWHGRAGPLPIRRYSTSELAPGQQAFLDSCVAAGFSRVDDHNAPGKIGAGPTPMNTVDHVRQSTALTYLAQARSRSNLMVRSRTTVDSILFKGKRATGVRLSGPAGRTISADRVVLAAGAFGSPAILMRTGVGPAGHLRAERGPLRERRGEDLTGHSTGKRGDFAAHPNGGSPLVHVCQVSGRVRSSILRNVNEIGEKRTLPESSGNRLLDARQVFLSAKSA